MTLYGRRFPPAEAVKALAYFEEGEAAEVDASTQAFLSRQVAAWDFTVARIGKAADTIA